MSRVGKARWYASGFVAGLQVLACLHHDACCQMGWLHAVRGHSSRSSRYVQYFKIDCQSCQTWVPFNVHCEEDGPKTQIHVSTHPSVQDGHRWAELYFLSFLSASSLFKFTMCYKRAMFDQSRHLALLRRHQDAITQHCHLLWWIAACRPV